MGDPGRGYPDRGTLGTPRPDQQGDTLMGVSQVPPWPGQQGGTLAGGTPGTPSQVSGGGYPGVGGSVCLLRSRRRTFLLNYVFGTNAVLLLINWPINLQIVCYVDHQTFQRFHFHPEKRR